MSATDERESGNGFSDDEWYILIHETYSSYRTYAKTAMTVAGGVFGSSAILYRDVFALEAVIAMSALKLAWAMLSLSIMASLVSLFCHQKAMEKGIDQVRKNEPFTPETFGGMARSITRKSSTLGFIALLFGVFVLACFAYNNLETIH